jgi:porphobilinogen synthase
MNDKLLRLKKNIILRNMCAETSFLSDQLLQPIFISENVIDKKNIPGLGDNYVLSINDAIKQVENDLKNNCRNFLLFLIPGEKNEYNFNLNFHSQAISQIKKNFKEDIFLWSDVCLCSMTTHGHCCIFDNKKKIDNEKSLKALSKIAVTYADSGIDGIAPSDMMDGRTKKIRLSLDKHNHDLIPIMSYSSKFASNFYGPFRDAADSAPAFGDRKHYQLDYRNKNDAFRASRRCAQEGADLLMVKPGLYSLDLIETIKNQTGLMVGAYQVSGEYAGINLASENNLLNLNEGLYESWHVMKRAGAQFIITYGARKSKELGFSAK